MPVLLMKKNIIHGGAIKIHDDSSTKFNSIPSGLIGVNNQLSAKPPPQATQAIKPIQASISYGGDLLNRIHFNNRKDNKNVKLKL